MNAYLQKLRLWQEKMPQYREVLDLAEKLLLEKQREKEKGSFPSMETGPLKAKIQLQAGFPFLKAGEAPLNLTRVSKYFLHLLKIFSEQNAEHHAGLKKIMDDQGFDFERFVKRLLENQVTESKIAQEWGSEGSLLFFFVMQSLKPTFELLAESWQKELKELSWAYGFCPFCGALPSMGEIREEGKRLLHCPLCAMEWAYPRMKCPYCQNEDQQKLTYFQVEGVADSRVDVCLHCRHYLKTMDTREREASLDWEIEDYLTLHLDHLAQGEGYLRPERLFVEVR